MRGKGHFLYSSVIFLGITPAYAGKSVAQAALNVIMRDHPRLCGEKSNAPPQNYTLKGSPPPMRGKERPEIIANFCKRITPAYAGKR